MEKRELFDPDLLIILIGDLAHDSPILCVIVHLAILQPVGYVWGSIRFGPYRGVIRKHPMNAVVPAGIYALAGGFTAIGE
jgi:hypothetical protein